jgi:hypothetical protein
MSKGILLRRQTDRDRLPRAEPDGTFDSIFLIGILAVLLAGLMKPR